jgi:hypothetical protein
MASSYVINIVMKITDPSSLTDPEVVTALSRVAVGEREATAALIVYLAEFDARRLYAPAGFSSTFKYCLEVLHLSEDAAFNRIEAARTARRFPLVVDMLLTGTLSPTTTRLLARHLTDENHEALLAAAAGRSKHDVEALLAGLFPQPDVLPSVRKVPVRNAAAKMRPDPTVPVLAPLSLPMAVPSAAPPARRPVLRPLAAERYEIRFTGTAATRDNLRRAQELLGHTVPSGDLAEVFDRALTLLVADLERKKLAACARPSQSRGQSPESRNIPAEVRRAVAARDDNRCAFTGRNGRRCDERRFLEFHHVSPYAARGKPTVENIQLRCQCHNRYEADVFFGPLRAYNGFAGRVTRSGTGNRYSSPTSPSANAAASNGSRSSADSPTPT